MPSAVAVWTVARISSGFLAPKFLAATTFAPTERPTNRLTSRLMRELVDPTAARELSPAKRPTTMMSAALNRSCKMPDPISGRANRSIFFRTGPDVMSIPYVFVFSGFMFLSPVSFRYAVFSLNMRPVDMPRTARRFRDSDCGSRIKKAAPCGAAFGISGIPGGALPPYMAFRFFSRISSCSFSSLGRWLPNLG